MGSFYLVNLILAIVAMSYDDCQKMEKAEEEEEAMVSTHIYRMLTARGNKISFWLSGLLCGRQESVVKSS